MVPYAIGDFVVCTRWGNRYRGIVTELSYGYRRPVVYVLDRCCNRKWYDYIEYAAQRNGRKRFNNEYRKITFTSAGVLKVLPKHKLVPYKLRGLLADVIC